MLRSKTIAAATVLCLMLLSAGCSGTDTKAPEEPSAEPIRIGAVLSLTGTYAGLGGPEKNAIELEVDRINEAGGIDGRLVEVIIEDDATDEAKAVAAATKLIEQDGVVAIIGATGTGQSMAIRGDIQRAGIPQVSMAGGTVITKEFDPLVFQTPWSNTIVVPYVLNAVKQAGHTKIAVLSDTGGYGKDGKPIIEAEAAAAGLEIVTNETFNPDDTDMTTQLTKVRSSGAQALVLWTAGKEAATIMKNAEGLGMTSGSEAVAFFGGSGQARLEFASGAGEASNGFTFGTGRSLVPENWGQDTEQYRTVTDFAQRYEARFSEAPDIFAGHAFDAMAIVESGLRSAGPDATGAELRDAIESIDGLVGFGGVFTFTPTDHNGLTAEDLALYRFSDGKWETAQ